MTLNKARILSSESSVKQEQNTNINIKIQPKQSQPTVSQPVQPIPQHQRVPSNQSVNFTQAETNSPSPSAQPTNNTVQERGVIDLGADITSLEMKNKFLEILLSIYETNPIKVNDLLICHSQTLME